MKKYSYPIIILAGGLGTRLREETEFRPKPMVPIGGKPILWHIMKIYAHYGFYRFIICLGYKGEMIKNYFLNYHLADIDLTVFTKTGRFVEQQLTSEDWEVTLVDTGEDTQTGCRVLQAARYVDSERFLLTYGDGLSDVNVEQLLMFHQSHKKLVTLTGVNLPSRFGNLELMHNNVIAFREKQTVIDEWINGGFFVCEKNFLNYLSADSTCVLEEKPLKNVALNQQLMIYKHTGFWQCMDTHREHQKLEALWKNGAPWKIWHDKEKAFTSMIKYCDTSLNQIQETR